MDVKVRTQTNLRLEECEGESVDFTLEPNGLKIEISSDATGFENSEWQILPSERARLLRDWLIEALG